MQFMSTPLPGAFVIELEPKGDDRGYFARQFCRDEFQSFGLNANIAQINMTSTRRARTLRGMHYQVGSRAETKIVRCLRGAIFDCIIDLREESSTLGQWFAETLTAENQRMMYVPKGFAHGLMTLTDDVEILYLMGESYDPQSERGIRYDDPSFAIRWPAPPEEMSAKDRAWSDYQTPHNAILDDA